MPGRPQFYSRRFLLLEPFDSAKLGMYSYHYAPALVAVFAAYARGDIIGDTLNNIEAYDPFAGKLLATESISAFSTPSPTHILIRGGHNHHLQ